jgi:hypothetical protein
LLAEILVYIVSNIYKEVNIKMRKIYILIALVSLILSSASTASAANLVGNGGFESPKVENSNNWDTYPTEKEGLEWTVDYPSYEEEGRLEIQKNVAGAPHSGAQHAELDSYHPVKISQDIETDKLNKYQLMYWWSPRPNVAVNELEVWWNGDVVATHSASGGSVTNWKQESFILEPAQDGIKTTLTFKETGPDDSYGMYLDDVEVIALEFVDEDNDGVNDAVDLCPGTDLVSDTSTWTKGWGTNRWQVGDVDNYWYQNKPSKKGKGNAPYKSEWDISYTYGCNGHQILEKLKGLGEAMEGHWKHGLSSSVLEDFHKNMEDGDIDGRYFVETIKVNSKSAAGTYTQYPTVKDINYHLEANGTYRFAPWGEAGLADAMYSYRIPNQPYSYHTNSDNTWVSGSDLGPYKHYLELLINSVPVEWVGSYHDNNYTYLMSGTGSNLLFSVKDDYYTDNSNGLSVSLYAQF